MIQPTALLNKILQATTFLVLLTVGLQAQTDPNFVDLGIRFVSLPPSGVKINQVFGVQAEVYLDANTTTVPAGETVTAEVTLVDPSGLIIQSHTQSWSGFNEDTDGNIVNQNGQLFLQVPWSQASKWTPTASWKIVLSLTASSVESDMTDNLVEQSFNVLLPDLSMSISNVTATDPLTGQETVNFVPNTNYTVSGTVSNIGEVTTQPSVHVSVVAQLRRLNLLSEGQFGLGAVMDEQSIVFPDLDDPLLYLPANGSWNFTIGNLFLPADASGQFVVTLEVNPADIPGGRVMMEQSYANNLQSFPSTAIDIDLDGTVDYYGGNIIEVGAVDENATSFPQLEFVPNSYNGEKGTFRGLDPAFISFAIRNNGTRPVAAGDEISASVLLSKDLQVDDSDFILREFDLGGNGIGLGMLAGETINLTWFQQLPDNFEGDYYLIVEMDNRGTSRIANVDTTPIFSLSSQGKGTTDLVPTDTTTSTLASERPSSGKDGRYVVYEKSVPDTNGENFQQIFLLDTQAPAAMPLLISKSFNDPSNQAPGNGSSLRPQISLDGTTVVFHSRASDLVPGDTNGKEDIFLYRLASNTLLRAVNDQDQQFNGRSLYPAVNGDGSKVVFESDATNAVSQNLNLQNQIFLWTLDPSGGGTITALTNGNGNSYNPSIDESGNRIVFDSFATNLLDGSVHTSGQSAFLPSGDVNSLRDIYFLDLTANKIYLASLNFDREQSLGGASMLPKISGDGQRIVFQSKAQNFVSGAGIATVVVTEGGAGYFGTPSIELVDEGFNSNGAPGSGAVLTFKPDGINELNELKDDAILVINTGSGYIKPNIQIIPDPAFPLPTYEAKVTAYLSNPEGDVYYVSVADLNGTTEGNSNIPSYSSRVSQSVENQTGGNFGSREPSINYDGSKIVYSTKSSNLLPESINRDDGKTFYNSTFELPTASAVLVGSIAEIEIENSGSGYSGGFLNIEDLSGTGFGAEASYEVDQRGRIVSIQIINSGENYRLESTQISVAEPLGGSGFLAGQARFFPTQGLGETRSGGGRIYKVEMNSYGLGYKIGEDENASFSDLVQFEGDGADLNGDGFPDGRLNPDRVHNFGGSLYLEQKFQVEILSGSSGLVGADILNTTLTISDKNNTLEPLIVEFEEGAGSSGRPTISITLGSTTKSDIRNGLIQLIDTHMDIATSGVVSRGPVIENNQSNGSTFTFSALSGRFTTNNPSAIKVIEESNMLIMGSGYTTVTPVINQVPSIYGFSEIRNDPSFSINQEAGRMTLLAQRDEESDDIYLFDLSSNTNTRVSRSSFGTPAGYLNNNLAPSPPSNRFPFISGNGRFVFFSSDSSGIEGLSFQHSNQLPTDNSPTRSLFVRDLKTSFIIDSAATLTMLFPSSDLNHSFAPESNVPVIADLNFSGSYSGVGMILNQSFIGNMTEFGGGGVDSSFQSGRFSASIPDLTSGEYSLQLVAYGMDDEILATSSIRRFTISSYSGSLPPTVSLADPSAFNAVTSTSIIPLSASGEDPDGALVEVQYYVDGVAYGDPLSRKAGITELSQNYATQLDLFAISQTTGEDQGIKSIFVIGRDNSGNYVTSDIHSISFTSGSEAPEINIPSGFLDFDLNQSDFNATVVGGVITGIVLEKPVGQDILSAVASIDSINETVDSGAQITPVIDNDPDSEDFAKITGFTIDPDSGGTGYQEADLHIEVIPVLRAINEGVPAQAGATYAYEYNSTTFENTFVSLDIALRQNIDGSLRVGSGYVLSPRLLTPPFNYLVLAGRSYERLPLSPSTTNTSSVEPFYIGPWLSMLDGVEIVGGFTQSPVIIEVNATETSEAIEYVSLVIDGQTSEDLTKTKPPYSFSWVPDIVKNYSISAIVRDVAGNVNSTPLHFISVENYDGGGISMSLLGESNFSVESNGQLPLVVQASSASGEGSNSGIAQVDFYIDNQKVGSVKNSTGNLFQTIIDLEPLKLRQGEHEITVVARDKVANYAGTFSSKLTNLSDRMNRILNILPPLPKNPPVIELVSPQQEITITKGSSIRLSAYASDPDGGLKGTQFIAGQHTLPIWNGKLDFNGSLPTDGSLLTLDDGTGNAPVTVEFDRDGIVSGGILFQPIPAVNNRPSTTAPVVSGTFGHPKRLEFVVEIDGPQTFRWSKDGGLTFVNEKVSVDGTPQPLADGITITMDATNDHYGIGDHWAFVAAPTYMPVSVALDSGGGFADIVRTRNNLLRELEYVKQLGLLSMHLHVDDNGSVLSLFQDTGKNLTGSISITGTALKAEGGTLVYINNDSDGDGNPDNMMFSQSQDNSLGEPFGFTFEANETGTYFIYAMTEDFYGNQVASTSSLVTVSDAEGKVPTIEFGPVEGSMVYSGSAVTASLSAEAEDPDGTIAEVSFYGNGVLIESDSSRPYSASFEINATGHYEVYAVARDNSGNLVTSNVRRIIVDEGGEEPVQPLVLSASSAYLGGVGEISGTYKSESGSYDSNIRALVYIDGSYAGDADLLPRTPPSVGEEDPGQSFTYDLPARGAGVSEVEIIITNDQETARASSQLFFSESVLTDDLAFINMLYDGLFKRLPEGFENGQFYGRLEDGTLTREQAIEEISRREEFNKARNMLLVHKTIFGEWRDLGTILSEIDPTFVLDSSDPTTIASYATRPDDAETNDPSATLVGMNQVVRGVIETPSDIDTFRIISLGPNQNGLLTVTLEAGHPGLELMRGVGSPIIARNFLTNEDVMIEQISDFHPAGIGYGTSGIIQRTYDLRGFTGSTDWEFYVRVEGNPLQTGPYALIFENRPVLVADELENFFVNLGQVPSAIMDYNFESSVGYLTSKFEYYNQYGIIGTHDPEELFTRLYKNKYEQMPSPRQIVRATDLIADVNRTQFEFAHQFILENKVITQGAYNYTQTESNSSFANLAIPNVPHDIAAFADTALVYLTLLDQVPTNAEVAKITLTPEYTLRPMTERARMIMEMPAFAARYGLAMPEVDLPNVRNGRTYSTGKNVLIDAASLGADNLAGTVDDGHIREIKVLFNGKDLNTNVLADGFYYEFQIPSLPDGEYLMEVIAEDKNGLTSRAQRNIFLGTPSETVALTSPAVDEVLDIDEEVDFKFSLSDPTYSAYLEVNGHIPWIGNIQLSGEDLPDDESNLTIKDGVGGEVTFEFDTDFSTSSTQTDAAEKMYVEGTDSLTASTSNYSGTEYREYLIEIDRDGNGTGPNGNDTFRWSIDGGAHFNNSAIEIDEDTTHSLSAGIEVQFDDNTSYSLGDRWRIKAYPTHEIVEVGRYGSFADRLATTRQNLVDAINRVNNEGKLTIRAKRSEVESTSSGWFDSLDQNKYGIELRRVGDFPIREKLSVDTLVSSVGNTTLNKADLLASPSKDKTTTNSPATLSLDLSKMGFTQPMFEARVVAFDDQNNTIYSEPRSFTLRDPGRLSIELTDPIARKASIRLKSSANGTLTNADFEILDGGAGYTVETAQLSIISEQGKGALLRAEINEAGEVAGVGVLSGGQNYSSSDLVLVSSPLQYKVGDSISVSARVRDPLSELERVAFYVNGVELDINATSGSETTYSASYEFTDESGQFVTTRALYGDDRDRGPSTIAEDEWMHGPGISGDRINYWGWRRHWAEQHFHGPGYVFPEWFIQDQEYWALPPPWLSLPYEPGALPVQVASVAEEDAISITSSTSAHVGNLQVIDFTFQSEDGEYDNSLNASVFVDGQFAGMAKKLDYNAPEFWEADSGYQFEFALPVHTAGQKEIEIFVTNGADTFSAYTTVNGEDSPLTDDYQFLKALWNGLFDRNPEGPEINDYLAALRNSSMTRPQVIEHIRSQQEFITSRDILLTHKTLHGVWEKLPIVLENTDQEGYGSMGGSGSLANQAAMGMPYIPADDNGSDFGFYEGVADDHGNMVSNGTWIGMNSIDVMAILSPQFDMDTFKIKSQNLADEGFLKLSINRAPFGTTIQSRFFSGVTHRDSTLTVHFKDGNFIDIDYSEQSGARDGNVRLGTIIWDLSPYQNVDFYSFKIGRQLSPIAGGIVFSAENISYLDQENFLTDEEIAQLQIDSRVNGFDLEQAIAYETNSFNYTNRYGQIETHDPASFFHRLFLNKYDQEPNPMQASRGVQLLKDGTRSQIDFLQQFATENNIITVGGYNYTTSANELAIPNVPIDAAAFAETALVYSALMGKAPSKAEVAKLTLDPYFEVRPLAERVQMILEMPEFPAQYGVSIPKVEFLNVHNGMVLGMDDSIKVEAFDHGIDGTSGTFDDGQIATVSLLLNGSPLEEKEGNRTGSEYTFDFNQSTTGEYDLEVVAHNLQGDIGRAHRRVFVGTRDSTISIDTPIHGAVLSKAAPAGFTFSTENMDLSNGKGYLEINGKTRWSGAFSITDDLMLDESTLTFHDGTNRESVTFEMDANEPASSYEIHSTTVRQLGEGNVTASGTYSGPAEGFEYWVIIDSNSSTFKWMEVGAMEPNATAVSINTDDNNYSLDYGVQIHFDSNDSYAFGDAWKIVVNPTTNLVEVETEGSFENRLARTKRNLISSINRANSEGLLAVHAEDPMAKSQLAGMLPVSMPVNRTVVLRHDGSYPIITDLNISTSAGGIVQQDMFSLVHATGAYNSDKTSWNLTLSNWDALELCDGLLEVRLIHIKEDGNISYSNKRAYPLVNPSRGYVELIEPMGTVYEPGRLPTVHFSENFSGSLPISNNGDITIVDRGTGYRWYDDDSKQFTIVSSSGSGGNLQIQEIDSQTQGVTKVYAESDSTTGASYHTSDVIVPSPPAFFEKYQTIDLSAQLRAPYSEYQRVAFYFNGVETNATVDDRSGGVFGTAFMPTLPGDKFVTVRALYGDSRDYGPRVPHTFGQYPCNDGHYGGKGHWGWKKSWLQQHYSTGQEFLPLWYNQHQNYWIHDNNEWAKEPMWDGAAPIRIGEKDVYEHVVILISSGSLALQGEKLHTQTTQVSASVQWSAGKVPTLTSVHLYGNKEHLAEITIETNDPYANYIPLNFTWFVNYKDFKDDFGEVDLKVVAVTEEGRQITSGIKRAYIRELSLYDPQSMVATLFKDITGESATDAVVKDLKASIPENADEKTMLEILVNYSIGQDLVPMADLAGAYAVLFGEALNTEEYFKDYDEWENNLLGYIRYQLQSLKYINKYGLIYTDRPQFFGNREGDNYGKRKEFVIRHFTNKFNSAPFPAQYIRGAELLWDARQANLNDNLTPAVDYIYNLVLEPTISLGVTGASKQPYLPFMKSTRADYVDSARQYMVLKLQTDDEQPRRLKVNLNAALDAVLSDPSFKENFNLLWDESPSSNVSSSWKNEEWFGWFTDETFPWIYHTDLGWLYSTSNSQNSIWFFSEQFGWFWTNKDTFKDHSNLTENQRFIFRVRSGNYGGWEGSWSLVTLPSAGSGSSAILLYDYGYSPL